MEPLVPTVSEPLPARRQPALASVESDLPELAPARVDRETSPSRPRRRGERSPRPAALLETPAPTPTHAPAAFPAPERRRGVQPVAERDEDDRRVVGFGSDLPAFLARPIPIPAKR
jgi:hypothetical protein